MAEQRGLVMINTGEGKGKSTAAFGLAMRAWGQGKRVLILQFIKSGGDWGELKALARLDGLEVRSLGKGFVLGGKDQAPHRQAARQAWEQVQQEALSGQWDLIVLDELCVAMKYEFITIEEAAELIQSRPASLHLLITGRYCPQELMDMADMVTEMRKIKHHYEAGIKSQAGVEY